jgi:hypothetical protein
MPMLVDSHCDLAWNMLSFGRDYNLAAEETRKREKGSLTVEVNGDTLIGWPDYQRGRTAIIFSTLFIPPQRSKEGSWDKLCYRDSQEAHQLYRQELQTYHDLTDAKPDHFRMIQNRRDLDDIWRRSPPKDPHPVGLCR